MPTFAWQPATPDKTLDPYVNGLIASDLRYATPGSVIRLPEGLFVMPGGNKLPIVPNRNVRIVGAGPDKTTLTQEPFAGPDKPGWNPQASTALCSFELNDGVVYENLCLDVPQRAYLQNLTVGWSDRADVVPPVGHLAKLINVWVHGPTCAVYCWASGGRRNRLLMDSCRVTSARVLVGQWASNANDTAWIDLYDCDLEGDWDRYGPGAGHTAYHLMAGLLCRRGTIRMFRGSISLKGGGVKNGVKLDRIFAMMTTNIDSAPAKWSGALIEHQDVKINIEPGGVDPDLCGESLADIGEVRKL